MKILVTGGPVHGNLDAVKIITNTFNGGLMASLAEELSECGVEVTYLCSKFSKKPDRKSSNHRIKMVIHDGIHDYAEKVKALSVDHDGVVLGAAVANLIPLETIKGKFPSHNYKPGDVINIPMTIAPRVIDMVKEANPKTKLFGFKLLAGVSQDELIKAAYGVLLESKATYVFANQMGDLDNVQMVTKERAVIPMTRANLASNIIEAVNDTYYRTELGRTEWHGTAETNRIFDELIQRFRDRFTSTPEGYVFGTVAVRDNDTMPGFLTTGRGKNELEDKAFVSHVTHVGTPTVVTTTPRKATLNAPLLDMMFRCNWNTKTIVHLHEQRPDLPTYAYAPSGTQRDSFRWKKDGDRIWKSFNIEGHGCYLINPGMNGEYL